MPVVFFIVLVLIVRPPFSAALFMNSFYASLRLFSLGPLIAPFCKVRISNSKKVGRLRVGCGRKKGEVELNQRKWRGRVRIAFVRRREGMERFASEICRASISRAILVTVWRRTTGTSCHNHAIFHRAVNSVEESKDKHARLQTRKQETALVIQIRTQRQCMTKCKGSNGATWGGCFWAWGHSNLTLL